MKLSELTKKQIVEYLVKDYKAFGKSCSDEELKDYAERISKHDIDELRKIFIVQYRLVNKQFFAKAYENSIKNFKEL